MGQNLPDAALGYARSANSVYHFDNRPPPPDFVPPEEVLISSRGSLPERAISAPRAASAAYFIENHAVVGDGAGPVPSTGAKMMKWLRWLPALDVEGY